MAMAETVKMDLCGRYLVDAVVGDLEMTTMYKYYFAGMMFNLRYFFVHQKIQV